MPYKSFHSFIFLGLHTFHIQYIRIRNIERVVHHLCKLHLNWLFLNINPGSCLNRSGAALKFYNLFWVRKSCSMIVLFFTFYKELFSPPSCFDSCTVCFSDVCQIRVQDPGRNQNKSTSVIFYAPQTSLICEYFVIVHCTFLIHWCGERGEISHPL